MSVKVCRSNQGSTSLLPPIHIQKKRPFLQEDIMIAHPQVATRNNANANVQADNANNQLTAQQRYFHDSYSSVCVFVDTLLIYL